ncbi:E3 ubiquitin-protein ligase Hakai-like [Camelus ferus]|uniref:E3 ubiquitin-protein ligase Hakai-like n=1 Tax=Camelus ferus TaxID=419612 RepID=A0A8B8RYH6_CAMFR|nr:E3 ubiquitin-protein ligase Hakai-like [Camelus ferus]
MAVSHRAWAAAGKDNGISLRLYLQNVKGPINLPRAKGDRLVFNISPTVWTPSSLLRLCTGERATASSCPQPLVPVPHRHLPKRHRLGRTKGSEGTAPAESPGSLGPHAVAAEGREWAVPAARASLSTSLSGRRPRCAAQVDAHTHSAGSAVGPGRARGRGRSPPRGDTLAHGGAPSDPPPPGSAERARVFEQKRLASPPHQLAPPRPPRRSLAPPLAPRAPALEPRLLTRRSPGPAPSVGGGVGPYQAPPSGVGDSLGKVPLCLKQKWGLLVCAFLLLLEPPRRHLPRSARLRLKRPITVLCGPGSAAAKVGGAQPSPAFPVRLKGSRD